MDTSGSFPHLEVAAPKDSQRDKSSKRPNQPYLAHPNPIEHIRNPQFPSNPNHIPIYP